MLDIPDGNRGPTVTRTCLDATGYLIVRELYRAIDSIDSASVGLLATIGSWGDTVDDGEVLRMLVRMNEGNHVEDPEQTK